MNSNSQNPLVPWQQIDTVLLDMDGTLLDLNYDNTIFSQLLPTAYAKRHQLSNEDAQQQLHGHMMGLIGTMKFYQLDYWRDFTGLNMMALHEEALDLIQFLPGAADFLQRLSQSPKRTLIVTNADRQSFQIKDRALKLTAKVDVVVSSHDYLTPKEQPAFWQNLVEQEGINPATSLFIDDTTRVLDSAKDFGIGFTLAMAKPDTQRPAKKTLDYPNFENFKQLLVGFK